MFRIGSTRKSVGSKFLFPIFLTIFLFSSSWGEVFFEVGKHVLDNGLTVLTIEDHSTPAISYQVWYHVGSKNERPGLTGISHFLEHLMFKGSENVKAEEHSKIIQANGGVDNAWTWLDNTTFWENLPSDKLDLAAFLESDRQRSLSISQESFDSEKEVVKEERRWRTDNDLYGAMFEQLQNLLWVAHPYHWEVIGFMSDIEAITLEDVREHYRRYYAPNNATVVISGDFKTEEALNVIHKYYDDMPSQPPPPSVTTVEPEQLGERRADVHKIAQLPSFIVGYHIPEGGHPDIYPLEVAARILFTGQSSHVYQRLIYQDQIATFVDGAALTVEDPGLFYILVGIQSGHTTEEGEKALYEEIDKLKSEPVTEKELQKAKNQLEAEFIFDLESNSDKGEWVGYYETVLGDYSIMFEEPAKYQAVTAEDVVRVCKKYLDKKNRTVVTLIPEAPPEPGT
ncbi:MAG: insulinase family protein [Candidatus Zixiibacteriota bacterium]|nr:MAG: insulinase family protein [candidate division Zixibacteria bacterium]